MGKYYEEIERREQGETKEGKVLEGGSERGKKMSEKVGKKEQ